MDWIKSLIFYIRLNITQFWNVGLKKICLIQTNAELSSIHFLQAYFVSNRFSSVNHWMLRAVNRHGVNFLFFLTSSNLSFCICNDIIFMRCISQMMSKSIQQILKHVVAFLVQLIWIILRIYAMKRLNLISETEFYRNYATEIFKWQQAQRL